MKITSLHIYPIKSMGGIDLMSSEVEFEGLKYDRRYALLDENHLLMTQRAFPTMVKFKLEMTENGFLIRFENLSLQIPFALNSGEKIQFEVWDDTVEGIIANAEINTWFSEMMGQKCQLVFQPKPSDRKVDPNYAINHEEYTSLADGYPLLMISEASLDFLNSNLDQSVEMKRFRPNIVVNGLEAFEEERINAFTVNNTYLYGVKPSGRCNMVTLNEATLKYEKEPLKTLAKINFRNNKVLFGQNVVVHQTGKITVGDSLQRI